MHCELVVPALFAARETPRLPAAELLIARGRARHGDAGSLQDWLAASFSIETHPLAAGALSVHAGGVHDPGASWVRADPIHLRLGADRPTLVPATSLEIRADEAEPLVRSLNAHFGSDASFVALLPGAWCARTASGGEFPDIAPIDLAGQAVDAHLPGRREAAFLTEIQMVLHDHPVNREREARGAPAVNSLWLWGSGKLPATAQGSWRSMSTDDLLSEGIARLAGVPSQRLPASGEEWLQRPSDEGRHLVLLDELRAALPLGGVEAHAALLCELEKRWFAPMLGALRAGRLGMLTLHVPEAGASWETIRGDLLRFWRRTRPLGDLA